MRENEIEETMLENELEETENVCDCGKVCRDEDEQEYLLINGVCYDCN